MGRRNNLHLIKVSILVCIFFLAILNNSYGQKITSNQLIGNWETIDKGQPFFTIRFIDSAHFTSTVFGKQWESIIWTYQLDTLEGNNMIIMKGKNPAGGSTIDSGYIRLKNTDSLQMRSTNTGKFNDIRLKGMVTDELWDGKDKDDNIPLKKAVKLIRVVK